MLNDDLKKRLSLTLSNYSNLLSVCLLDDSFLQGSLDLYNELNSQRQYVDKLIEDLRSLWK